MVKVFERFMVVLAGLATVLPVIPSVRRVITSFLSPDAMAALLLLFAATIGLLAVWLAWIRKTSVEKHRRDAALVRAAEASRDAALARTGEATQEKPRARGDVGPIDALNWTDAVEAMKKLADDVASFHPDLVIGIDRGGAIVGGVIAKHLGRRMPELRMSTMASSRKWTTSSPEESLDDTIKAQLAQGNVYQKILVVDDACRFGTTMRRTVQALRRLCPPHLHCDIRIAVVLSMSAPAGPSGHDRLGPDKSDPDYCFYTTPRQDVRLPWDLPRA